MNNCHTVTSVVHEVCVCMSVCAIERGSRRQVRACAATPAVNLSGFAASRVYGRLCVPCRVYCTYGRNVSCCMIC